MNPALVLLHGFTGSPGSWDAVRAALPPTIPVLAPPLVGHGPGGPGQHGTSPPAARAAPATFTDEVDRLAARVRDEAAPGSVLVGYSMGARAALGLLVRHRQLFRRAVLIGCNPGLATDSERRERAAWEAAWIARLETEGIDAFVDAWSRLPLFDSQATVPADRRTAQDRIRRAHDPRGLARALRTLGLAAMPDYRPRLPDLDLPVTLVTGARDEKFERLADAMLPSLPRGRRLTAEGAGHNLLLERPEWLARVLIDEWNGRE